MKDKLFRDFSPISKNEWIGQIEQDLKGKDFENTVVSKILEGIQVAPFYNVEDAENTRWLKPYQNKINPKPEIPGIPPRNWSNVAEINVRDEKKSSKEILDVLQNGANGLLLNLEGKEDLDILLEGVHPQFIHIFLKSRENSLETLRSFFKWINKNGFKKNDINGGLLWNGYSRVLEGTGDHSGIIKEAGEFLDLAVEYPHFKVLTIDTEQYHNTGADSVQETSFAISAFMELMDGLTAAGRAPREIFEKLIVRTAVGSDYFLEIAKLRVLRILVHQLASLYQVDLQPKNIYIFSSTSFWTKTATDVHTNMLRNTTEAMASILGGCNALRILPHDVAVGSENGFSKRMAINTSSILEEESYLNRVVDPVSGTYYLEFLMDTLYDLIKNKIIDLESGGGWWRAYEDLMIQKEIKATRNARMQALVNQKSTKIGVNKFVNSLEVKPDFSNLQIHEDEQNLRPFRESYLAEQKIQNQS